MLSIREEQKSDENAIHLLTEDAFKAIPFSDGQEASIIKKLRASGDLSLSLVAEGKDSICGHVAFSPVTINGKHNNWFGLGPISVHPEKQGCGIGRSLIKKGLDTLKKINASGCALIGNPDIYSKMGFQSDGNLIYEGVDPKIVQRIIFKGSPPTGILKFAPAFY